MIRSTKRERPGGLVLFPSLRAYNPAWLPRDLVAGLTLLAIALPAQLATAQLAGMPANTGLLAFGAGAIGFAALGSNQLMSVAADSTIAPIFASTLAALAGADPARYAILAALLALIVGIVLVVAGLARAGWIADLLSIPVTVGFLAGISVHIIVAQLPNMLGITVPTAHILLRIVMVVERLQHANLPTTAIGIAVLAGTLAAERPQTRIPGALISLFLASFAVWLLGLNRVGVELLGTLPAPWPHFTLLNVRSGDIIRLVPLALTIALVCMIQTAAVARTFPSKSNGEEDISSAFTGVGASNILAGLIGSFAVNVSPPSTAAVAASGGCTQISELIAAAIILALAVFGSGLLVHLPVAALSGILVFIALRIFRLRDMIAIARGGGQEILLVIASACLVIALPIEMGVGLSIILSLLHSVYILARPACTELERIPGTTIWWSPSLSESRIREPRETEPGVIVFALAAPINFTNANYIRRRLLRTIAEKALRPRLVVLDASGVDFIDYTGSLVLQQQILALRREGIDVALARLGAEHARRSAAMSGLVGTLGEDRIFYSAEEAVRALRPRNPPLP